MLFSITLGGKIHIRRATKMKSVCYHVDNDTLINSVKDVLANVKPKAEWTKYLGEKVYSHFQNSHSKVLIAYCYTIMRVNYPLQK